MSSGRWAAPVAEIRLAVTSALMALVIASCASVTPATSPTAPGTPVTSTLPPAASASSSTTPAPAATAWERALATIGGDGKYSLEAALNLFATAFGPVPGVDVAQDLTGIGDRTIAISSVMAHRSELTSAQRAAIDAYVEMPADADVIKVPPVAEARNQVVFARMDDASKTALTDAALDVRADIAKHLGRDFAGDISIGFLPTIGPPTKYGGT